MKNFKIIGIIFLIAFLLVSPALADITDSTVDETNIYSTNPATRYDISVPGSYSNTTATNITYINAVIVGTPNVVTSGLTVTTALEDRRGSLITTDTIGTKYATNMTSGATVLSTDVYPNTYIYPSDGLKTFIYNYGNYAGITSSSEIVSLHTQDAWEIIPETLEIEKKSTNIFNPTNQFAITTPIIDLKYISLTEAILIYGNSVYIVDSRESLITPVSLHENGGTITKGYIGEFNAITVDTDGVVLVYNYNNRTAVGLKSNITTPSDIVGVASINDYAIIATSTHIQLYDAHTGEFISQTAASVKGVCGKDTIARFLSYPVTAPTNVVYSWAPSSSGLTASVSTTLTEPAVTINEINRIAQTDSFIVGTSGKTYIISIPGGGPTSSIISTAATTLTQLDSSLDYQYVGNDGKDTYQYAIDITAIPDKSQLVSKYTVSTNLNDVAVSHTNGLWSAFGGYGMSINIMAKDSETSRTLMQNTLVDGIIDQIGISYAGYYLIATTDDSIYLLSQATPLDVSDTVLISKYYAKVSIMDQGLLQPNTDFTVSINSGAPISYTTVSDGTFTMEVYPTYTYIFTYKGNSVKYIANNYALQYVFINSYQEYYMSDVTYSVSFNNNTDILMRYYDGLSKGNTINYVVADANGTVLYTTGTIVSNNYYHIYSLPVGSSPGIYTVKLTISSNGVSTVKDWSFSKKNYLDETNQSGLILPGAKKPIIPLTIPMIPVEVSGNVIQIIFCIVLMIVAGLFGVNYSAKGTLIVALLALLFTYFGLIHIDWLWAVTMVVLGILTIFSYASQNEAN